MLYKVQKPIQEFCAAHGIAIGAYSSLAQASAELLAHYQLIALSTKYKRTPAQVCSEQNAGAVWERSERMEREIVVCLCCVACLCEQILLRWALEKHVPIIPKSTHQNRIIENSRCTDFALQPAEVAALDFIAEDRAIKRRRMCWDPNLVPF